MQNWNQWQLPAGPVTAPMPQPPIGYAAPGADPMATMQAYMQYYNQPAPSGYTAEQWATAQQQNWAQWQTWQQQYQQWQAQYGEKYQETMKQMSSQGLTNVAQIPSLTIIQPPPLPKEDTSVKPPLPPDGNSYVFGGIPPPHQNNLPLFPSKLSANPPLPPGQPPLPSDSSTSDSATSGKRGANSNLDSGSAKKLKVDDDELTEAEKTFDAQFKQWEEQFNKWKQQNANHPDKTQYKQYEAKWTSWREKLIERREQMRRKREQQKQAAAKAEAEKNKTLAGDDKILNILSSTENQGLINNLLGIGKTLGLTGKPDVPGPSSGVASSGQQQSVEPTTAMGVPTMTPNMNQAAWAAQQWAAQYNAGMNMTNYGPGYQQPASIPPPVGNMLPHQMPSPNFNQPPSNFNQPPTNFNQPSSNFNQPPANFNQPPPNMSVGPPNLSTAPPNMSTGGMNNFSQPPPGFGPPNTRQPPGSGPGSRPGPGNTKDSNSGSFRPEGEQRQGPPPGRDSMGPGNDRYGFQGNRFGGPGGMNHRGDIGPNDSFGRDGPNDCFGPDGSNKDFYSSSDQVRRDGPNRDFSPGDSRIGNDFRSNNRPGGNNDRFGPGFDRNQYDRFGRDGDRYKGGDQGGDNRFGSDRDSFNSDRFSSNNDRFGPNNDRFNSNNDRAGPSGDRFGSGGDQSGPGPDRFGLNNDQSRPGSDRIGLGNDQSRFGGDRFGSGSDQSRLGGDRFGSMDKSKPISERFGASNDRLGSGNDQFNLGGDRFGSSTDRPPLGDDRLNQANERFGRPPPDRFDSRDGSRDSFGSNSRSFGRSNQFEPSDEMAPELKKLMEKRRSAMDVFKPSNFGSLLDSDRNKDTSSSLSESFRRITGDLPFSRNFGDVGKDNFGSNKDTFPSNKDSFGPKGPPPSSSMRPGGPGNFDSSRDFRPGSNFDAKFRGPGDLKPFGPGDSRPRGPGEFGSRSNEFGSRDADTSGGPRRSGDFPPTFGNDFEPRMRNEFQLSARQEQHQQRDNFGPNDKFESNDEFGPSDNRSNNPENSEKMSMSRERENEPSHTLEEQKELGGNFKQTPPEPADLTGPSSEQDVPPLQMPPWMDSEFADDNVIEKAGDELAGKTVPPFSNPSTDKSQPLEVSNSGPTDADESHKLPETEKKSDTLPFMGENDPKPEDLNMEPPPELPNLGPLTKEPERPFETRGSNMRDQLRPPSDDCNPRLSFDSPIGPRGMQMRPRGPMPFGPRGPGDGRFPPNGPRGIDAPPENMGSPGQFRPRGPNTGPFGPCGPQDDRFNPRGPLISPFGPRGLGDFGPRGFGDFGPRGPPDFGPLGPSNFGPPGPPDFGALGPSNFGPPGPTNFGSSGPTNFGPRGPSDFGPRGPSGFGPRGPSDFGPGNSNDNPFGPRELNDGPFGPRELNDGPFGPRELNDGPFGPLGSLDKPFGPCGPNDSSFGPRPPFGPNNFGPRGGNVDGSRPAIPSLMSFKFDRPKLTGPDDMLPPHPDQIDLEPNREQDLPPAFRGGDQDQRPFGGDQHHGNLNRSDSEFGPGSSAGLGAPGGPNWRQPFIRNKFGDSDQRTGPGDFGGGLPMGSANPMDMDRERLGSDDMGMDRPPFGPPDRTSDLEGIRPRGEPAPGYNDKKRTSEFTFMTRRCDKRSMSDQRGGSQKEFCIEKQFNYNHSGGIPDEISTDHVPSKIIDYLHAPRTIEHEYKTPAQCFDYGHGNLKPLVPDHEVYPKTDFRHWVESEQNLKDYTDRMRSYESDLRALNRGRPERERHSSPTKLREPVWIHEERRSFDRDRDRNRDRDRDRRALLHRNERNRRDKDMDDHRERERNRENRERGRIERDREWERSSNKNREERLQQRRSNSKDRTRDRPERVRKESNKENNKDDERSKGNVSGQESSAKKPAESTPQETSNQEIQNEELEAKAKSPEPPKTMEIPKTPNFTMVDDLLCSPGRQNRPPKIVVILRGPPGSGKSFVAKLIKDKEVEQGGSAPRILSLDDYFLTEKEIETEDDNGKKITTKEMVYEYEEAMESSYITSLIKAFKKNITDGFFNFIILDSINEKISDYEEMWSFAKTKGFRVYVCEMEMDVQICLKRNIHKRTEDEINRIVDYFEPTPNYHQKLDVTSMLQEQAIEEVQMEDSQDVEDPPATTNDDSQDSQEDSPDPAGVSKWERMEAEDKLDRLDGLAKRKNEGKPQTMEDFLQVPDYYNMEDTPGKKRVRWADLEERKEQEKMRAVGFVVGQTNWDRMMDPTKGGSALTRTKYI